MSIYYITIFGAVWYIFHFLKYFMDNVLGI